MRLLITNDDGVNAPGLHVLAERLLRDGHEIIVVAPSQDRSGSATSLGVVVHEALIAVEVIRGGPLQGVRVLAVDAPPALAVRAAGLGAFGPPPEMVVSGVNPGFNTGRMVLHSGTVGAAMTAVSLDINGIAVSTAGDSAIGNETAAEVASVAVAVLARSGLDPLALNLNVPGVEFSKLGAATHATLGSRSVSDVEFSSEDIGLRVRRILRQPPFDHGSDADLVSRGYVSVTAICGPWQERQEGGTLAAELELELHRLGALAPGRGLL